MTMRQFYRGLLLCTKVILFTSAVMTLGAGSGLFTESAKKHCKLQAMTDVKNPMSEMKALESWCEAKVFIKEDEKSFLNSVSTWWYSGDVVKCYIMAHCNHHPHAALTVVAFLLVSGLSFVLHRAIATTMTTITMASKNRRNPQPSFRLM